MPTTTGIKIINIATNGTIDYQPIVGDSYSTYILQGSGTLSSSATVAITGSSNLPLTKKFVYKGAFTLNGQNITIQGTALTQQQATGGNTIIECNKPAGGGAWIPTYLDSSTISPKSVDGVKTTILSGAGGMVTLNPATDFQTQVLEGSGTLAGSYVYQANFTANGQKFRVIYNGSFAATGSDIEIFGVTLTNTQMLNGKITIDAEYDGSATKVSMSQSPNTIFAGLPEIILKEISFADGERAANPVVPNYGFILDAIVFTVTAPITNTYTIDVAKNFTDILQTLTFNSGDLLGTSVTTSFPPNTFIEGDLLTMDVNGSSGGGRVCAQIDLFRT